MSTKSRCFQTTNGAVVETAVYHATAGNWNESLSIQTRGGALFEALRFSGAVGYPAEHCWQRLTGTRGSIGWSKCLSRRGVDRIRFFVIEQARRVWVVRSENQTRRESQLRALSGNQAEEEYAFSRHSHETFFLGETIQFGSSHGIHVNVIRTRYNFR